jgi:diacylglycerol kinase
LEERITSNSGVEQNAKQETSMQHLQLLVISIAPQFCICCQSVNTVQMCTINATVHMLCLMETLNTYEIDMQYDAPTQYRKV